MNNINNNVMSNHLINHLNSWEQRKLIFSYKLMFVETVKEMNIILLLNFFFWKHLNFFFLETLV